MCEMLWRDCEISYCLRRWLTQLIDIEYLAEDLSAQRPHLCLPPPQLPYNLLNEFNYVQNAIKLQNQKGMLNAHNKLHCANNQGGDSLEGFFLGKMSRWNIFPGFFRSKSIAFFSKCSTPWWWRNSMLKSNLMMNCTIMNRTREKCLRLTQFHEPSFGCNIKRSFN